MTTIDKIMQEAGDENETLLSFGVGSRESKTRSAEVRCGRADAVLCRFCPPLPPLLSLSSSACLLSSRLSLSPSLSLPRLCGGVDTGLAGNPAYNFMKLDIQGAETIALQGATETLKNVEVCRSPLPPPPLPHSCSPCLLPLPIHPLPRSTPPRHAAETLQKRSQSNTRPAGD